MDGPSQQRGSQHDREHVTETGGGPLAPPGRDLLTLRSRRWFLQTGMRGLGGLTLPGLLRAKAAQAGAATPASPTEAPKAVIVFWLSGGISQIDSWDPKPNAPREIRGPFLPISTAVPGTSFCEHLPLQASIADKLSVLRAVDCRTSNHTPITLQAGNPLARRTNDGRDGGGYPSMGSVVSKFRGPNDPMMPAFVGLAKSWAADVYGAGHLGSAYDPVNGLELAGKFNLPKGIELDRLDDRNRLRRGFDRMRRDLDQGHTLERTDRFTQQAYDMVLSGRVQQAFNLDEETDETRNLYGRESVGEKALLARRLVEAGSTYVLVSGAWGYFDHHGDDVRWGGIEKGLKPLLPRIDRALYGLITDLERRGLLDSTLVLMMGEFGRTPAINEQAGRHHWTNVMSMLMAGGGLRHGQVIGATDSRGGEIQNRAVFPQDLAATVFRYLGIDLASHWMSPQGRPMPIIVEGGKPIGELFS